MLFRCGCHSYIELPVRLLYTIRQATHSVQVGVATKLFNYRHVECSSPFFLLTNLPLDNIWLNTSRLHH